MHQERKIGVSRLSLGLVPDQIAFRRLATVNEELGVSLGLEVNPHRLATAEGFKRLSEKFGISIIGVHGALYSNYFGYRDEFFRDLHSSPREAKGALLNIVWALGFGVQKDPAWLLRYRSHAELARALGAYLVVHHESLQEIGQDVLRYWVDDMKVRVLRENGWGAKDARPDRLSWDSRTIREFADAHNMGTVLDTSTAARVGLPIVQAYDDLKPDAVHFSDFCARGGKPVENLIPGRGDHAAELRELLQEMEKRPDVAVVIEVWPKPDLATAIGETLNFISEFTGQSTPLPRT